MRADRLYDLRADPVDRIERVHRALGDERDPAPADLSHFVDAQGEEVAPRKRILPAAFGVIRQDTQDRACDRRLAAAGFADDADRLSVIDGERNAVQRMQRPASCGS